MKTCMYMGAYKRNSTNPLEINEVGIIGFLHWKSERKIRFISTGMHIEYIFGALNPKCEKNFKYM